MSRVQASMKCHKCAERAAIRMRHHHIALCKEHYLQWFVDQTERAIKKYRMFRRDQHILVAVSGGKDSLALWDVLTRLGFNADGLYINLGIQGEDEYSDRSQAYAVEFASARGLKLHIVNVAEAYGASIPEIALRTRRGREKPCGVCGLAKRHVMNRIAREGLTETKSEGLTETKSEGLTETKSEGLTETKSEGLTGTQSEGRTEATDLTSGTLAEESITPHLGYDILATAHNLDDEVAVLMGNIMNWHVDLLARQSPVLEAAPGFARKVKPFCRFYERETAAYSLLRGIPYIEEECPFAVGSKQLYYKDLLNKIEEEQPGTKLAFYVGFLNAKDSGSFQSMPKPGLANEEGEEDPSGPVLYPCPRCGQPTTNQGLCAFCRTIGNP